MSARAFGASTFGIANVKAAAPRSLGLPSAMYPGAVATNEHLTIAVDRLQTRLAQPLTAGATEMIVVDGSRIVANTLLTIDNEIVETVSGAGNDWQILRGRDGTAPAAHLASAIVSGFVDAWHHNVLASEVQAIEYALGPNLGNISGESVFLISTQFMFPPIAPGGSLTPGTNMITLSPVPKGINGSDEYHYLRVSGGTGTAENVLITGGTAVSGAASGTLFFTCANAHSGAWTLQSATAGIQEAAQIVQTNTPGHVAGGGEIRVPAGVHEIYGTITLFEYTSMRGAGPRTTVLNQNIANVSLVTMPALYSWGVWITDLSLKDDVSTTGGALIDANNVNDWGLQRCFLQGGYYGVHIQKNFRVSFSDLHFTAQKYAGVIADGAESADFHWRAVEVIGEVQYPFIFKNAGGIYLTDVGNYGGSIGMQLVPGAGQHVGDIFMANCGQDSGTGIGFLIAPQAADAYVTRVQIVNGWSATNSIGLEIDATLGVVRGVEWVGGRVINNTSGGIGVVGNAKEVILSTMVIGGNSTAGNGANPGVAIGSGASEVKLLDCRIGQPYDWYAGAPFTNQHNASIVLYDGPSDYIELVGNRLVGDVAALYNGSTGTHNVIEDNVGYNPVGTSSITVGASPFTYIAGPSPVDVYIYGGTVSNITRNGITVANSSPASIALRPNDRLVITYSVAPAMVRDVH